MNKVFMIGNLTKDPDLRSTGNGVCGKYLAKGRKVAVVGELQTRTYDAKDGTKRYVTEIIADDVEFLTPRNQDGGEGGFGGGYGGGRHQAPAAPAADGFADIEDDELPF